MIEVRNLTKRYGSNLAVDDVSFTIENGKVYGLLGPNGAGKSTTMNIMTGYLAATSGDVVINGHDIVDEPEQAKKYIGYLPEIPPLYMEMTVKEYLKFAASLKKVPPAERDRQISDIMELVTITDKADRLIRNLSKGYKQRVGLAQAILGYPETIILDEPTVGLDPKEIIEVRDLIHTLSSEHTIILSSHILSEISEVCNHIMIIAGGRLVANDSAENLTRNCNKNILYLCIRGEEAAVRALLEEAAGKENIENLRCDEDGTCLAEITTSDEKDVRERVFYACAQARMPLLRMDMKRQSLEDVFIELTGSGTKAEGGAQT